MSDEERERKPQVNGEDGHQQIQIKVKMGTCRRTLRPAGGSLRARVASRSSRQRWGSAPRLLCSARGGMWAVAAEAGGARRALQRERTWAFARGCFTVREAVCGRSSQSRESAARKRKTGGAL